MLCLLFVGSTDSPDAVPHLPINSVMAHHGIPISSWGTSEVVSFIQSILPSLDTSFVVENDVDGELLVMACHLLRLPFFWRECCATGNSGSGLVIFAGVLGRARPHACV